jgi:anti-sigma factor RsiW
MTCDEARDRLLSARRGRLSPEEARALAAHLEGCAACRAEDAADRALDEALASRLPRHAAPAALKAKLSASARPPSRWRAAVPAIAAAVAVAASVSLYYERAVIPRVRAVAQLETEVVNDHLRLVTREQPLPVESGGIHQVKPWFTGKLDFAPVVPFSGDDEFPLQGGAVSWLLDRKAAAFEFKRRLHTITLLVFRAEGLRFPGGASVSMGHAEAHRLKLRGFNVVMWRDGDLGYSLVSDVDGAELLTLGAKITP